MGADSIGFTLQGEASRGDIQSRFDRQRLQDREDNGSRDGYSGDFQTVDSIDYRLHETFESQQEAMEYCLRHAQKWSTVVAVRFKVKQLHDKRGTLKRATDAYSDLRRKLDALRCESLDKLKARKGLVKCSRCGSRIKASMLHAEACPVCRESLRLAPYAKRIAKLEARIQAATDKINTLKAKLSKVVRTDTLVAGWGAC